jgi:uncharacterized membrane protein YtjA (UPF0391 family)
MINSPAIVADAGGILIVNSTRESSVGSAVVAVAAAAMELLFCPNIVGHTGNELERAMLNLVVTLLIIGLIAAVLGFGGIAGTSFALAKLIFFVVLVLFLISIIFGTIRRRPL